MAAKKKSGRIKRIARVFDPRSFRGGIALFALVFAIAGGGYFAYKSFAATATNPYPCSPSAYGIPTTTLRQGSSGSCVKHLQWYLNRNMTSICNMPGSQCGPVWSMNVPLTIDGVFGSRTTAAVRDFQRACRLSVDGVVGAATWSKLFQGWYKYGGGIYYGGNSSKIYLLCPDMP